MWNLEKWSRWTMCSVILCKNFQPFLSRGNFVQYLNSARSKLPFSSLELPLLIDWSGVIDDEETVGAQIPRGEGREKAGPGSWKPRPASTPHRPSADAAHRAGSQRSPHSSQPWSWIPKESTHSKTSWQEQHRLGNHQKENDRNGIKRVSGGREPWMVNS